VGGLVADVFILLMPAPSRVGPYRLMAVVVPVILWATYFLVLDLQFGVTWVTELWSGTIAMAGLSGLGLSLLTTPPASEVRSEA
jgi:hypothetical protein